MTERQQELLKHLVEIHIESAAPVSSSSLAKRGGLGVSSATIRNDLSALEQRGYIVSPHTSSGRVPTEKGYRFYIEWFVRPTSAATSERRTLQRRAVSDGRRERMRRVAEALSELTGQAVVLSESPEESYATGMSRLLAMPEFAEHTRIVRIAQILDARERWLRTLGTHATGDVQIMLGSDGPFGAEMTSITVGYHTTDRRRGMIALIGPMRMHYEQNIALLREAKRLLESKDDV